MSNVKYDSVPLERYGRDNCKEKEFDSGDERK